MSTYYANDKYSAVLTSGYTVGQTTLYVSAVPNHVPTIIVAAKGTDNETIFEVTGKTTNSLTGVSRLRGANVDLDAQTPLTCLNNEEFINQLASVSAVFNEEHDETGKHTTDQINEKTEDAGVTVDGVKMKDNAVFATQPSCQVRIISPGITTATGAVTTISFNAENWDTHDFHDNSTNPERITIPAGLGGRYLVVILLAWASNGVGYRRVYLQDHAGNIVSGIDDVRSGEIGGYGVQTYIITAITNLTAEEYYRFDVQQNSGGDLSLYNMIATFYKLP